MSDMEKPSEDDEDGLVVRGADGDPVQDTGTRMVERESYERVIEGLKMSADACAHLARLDPKNVTYWHRLRDVLDRFRRAAVHVAGIEDNIRTKQTGDAANAMPLRAAHDRLYEGLKQAEGGMRQLAMCHRLDLAMARMAHTLEEMVAKVRARNTRRGPKMLPSGLILPGSLH